MSYTAPCLNNTATYMSFAAPIEISSTLLSYDAPYLIYASPIELRGTLLNDAAFYRARPHTI